jgi:hypothetical protein
LASGRMLANQPNHGAMRTTLSIYRDCIKSAARGNSPFANDWAWASGTPASQWVARSTTPFAGSTVALIRWAGSGDLMSAILDGILAAGAAFFVTWMVAFVPKLLKAPADRYFAEKERADSLESALRQREVEKDELKCQLLDREKEP